MDLSKSGVGENAEDASSDSEVAQFYRPGLYIIVLFRRMFGTVGPLQLEFRLFRPLADSPIGPGSFPVILQLVEFIRQLCTSYDISHVASCSHLRPLSGFW